MSARRGAALDTPTRRWPVLLLIPLLIVGAVLVQRHEDDEPVVVAAAPVDALMPVATEPDAPSSTWYCAAGTATGTEAGVAEQTVEIANVSDADLTARLTAVPDAGAPVEKSIPLPARSRQSVVLSTLVVAPNAAAIVEVDGGEIAVSHVLTGPTGTSTAACSSAPSATWYFPSGNSEQAAASHQQLALFNPFPSDAVVDVTFDTDDGARAPVEFSSVVVPGNRVTVLDVSKTVTLRTEIATTVLVRSGRVIADQLQFADGTQDTVKSLAVTPGAPEASPTWWFADGPASAGEQTSIAVQNPSDHDVDVELQVRLDDAATTGVDPFAFTVPAGRAVVTNVSADGRVPPGIGFTAVVTATDGTPIVADRIVTVSEPETGMTVTMGSPALASRWLVPVASGATVTSAAVIITNPSATEPVTVTVSRVADGTTTPMADADQVVIDPGQRLGLPVPDPDTDPLVVLDVVTSAPVVVEARLVFEDAGLAAPLAVPVQGTVEVASDGLPLDPESSVTLDPSDSGDPDPTVDSTIPPDDTTALGDAANSPAVDPDPDETTSTSAAA